MCTFVVFVVYGISLGMVYTYYIIMCVFVLLVYCIYVCDYVCVYIYIYTHLLRLFN